MFKRLKKPVFQLTIVERVIVCLNLALLALMGQRFQFAGLMQMWFLVAGGVFLILASQRRITLCFWIGATIYAAVPVVSYSATIYRAQTLATPVAARQFQQAPLPEVLWFLARQNPDWPCLNFITEQKDVAQLRVSVTFPAGCTLREALEKLCQASACQYAWKWSGKGCGNAPEPTSRNFFIARTTPNKWMPETVHLRVDGSGITYPPGWSTNTVTMYVSERGVEFYPPPEPQTNAPSFDK